MITIPKICLLAHCMNSSYIVLVEANHIGKWLPMVCICNECYDLGVKGQDQMYIKSVCMAPFIIFDNPELLTAWFIAAMETLKICFKPMIRIYPAYICL